MDNDKVLLKFIKKYSPYNVDEIAGFTTDKAMVLIKHEVAVPVSEVAVLAEEVAVQPTKHSSKIKRRHR